MNFDDTMNTENKIAAAIEALDQLPPVSGCAVTYRAGYSHPLAPALNRVNVHVRYSAASDVLLSDRAWGPVIDALRGVGFEQLGAVGLFTRTFGVAQ